MWKDKKLFGLTQFQLPKNTSSLQQNIEIPPNLVLGKRAELFFAEAIRQSSNYDLIAQNLQLIHDKQTLGEFDFFLNEINTNQTIHVELVYKFYVYDLNFENELDRWIGPNRKDTLLKKIDRLKSHQLQLLYKKESKSLLKEHKIELDKTEQQVCFLANLFVPKSLLNHQFKQINNSCILGYWLHENEFSQEEYGSFEFYSPKKPDWPVEPQHHQNWKSYAEILHEVKYLLQHQKAALMWMKKDEQTYERFFIVWW
ncbi:DUF1853 family protein [Mesonia aestuariivivens]|uniref:DUF1853 family protein n=1 Tax=Mesonia aestuariivivens TaxID=2796128 RepID=A0ABS6W383_9FLAO|nr:DUF1853 family protein [Mesonia aestuariivivens]MBW2961574.1 DUF1853 family protein [Mesonia aestuariivivens]